MASRSLRAARQPVRACVTVTHVDGLVLARSVFEHAVNYRCAMVYGVPEVLTDRRGEAGRPPGHQRPGGPRAVGVRAGSPSAKELAATTVLRMTLDECSVKIRRGPPDDGDGPDAAPRRVGRRDPVADGPARSGGRSRRSGPASPFPATCSGVSSSGHPASLRAALARRPTAERACNRLRLGEPAPGCRPAADHVPAQSRTAARGTGAMPWASATGP